MTSTGELFGFFFTFSFICKDNKNVCVQRLPEQGRHGLDCSSLVRAIELLSHWVKLPRLKLNSNRHFGSVTPEFRYDYLQWSGFLQI